MKAELIPFGGGAPIPITRDVTVVGRRSYCDVVLDDPSLSKRHCVVVKTDGLLVIRDLATTNGTKVKGQKIRWAALLPEDRISFGKCKFRVYLGPDDVASPSEKLGLAGGVGLVSKAAAHHPNPTPMGIPVVAAPPKPATPAKRPAKPFDDDMPQLNLDDPTWLGGLSQSVADESDLIIELD